MKSCSLLNVFKKFYGLYCHIFKDEMPLDIFKDWDAYWIKRNKTPLLYRYIFIANHLPSEGSVLDIGCGDGAFLKYLREKKPKIQVFGVDKSYKALDSLRKEGFDCIHFDVENGSLSEEIKGKNIDYVVIMEVLEHLYYAEELMQEVKKIFPRYCYVTIPNFGYIVHRLRLALGGKAPITSVIFHIREHIRFWTVKDFYY